MITDLRSKLSVYLGELLSAGIIVFTREEAQHGREISSAKPMGMEIREV